MDMQGSKIAITLPTGQVVEYELMRIGTVREYRELVKTHDSVRDELTTRQRRDAERDEKIEDLTLRAAEAERNQRDAEEALTAAHASTGAQKARRAGLASKIEEHRSALAELLPELLGAIDELHEG